MGFTGVIDKSSMWLKHAARLFSYALIDDNGALHDVIGIEKNVISTSNKWFCVVVYNIYTYSSVEHKTQENYLCFQVGI